MRKVSLSGRGPGLKSVFLFLSIFLFKGQLLLAANVTTVDASVLTPEVIKKSAELNITGLLTAKTVEAFKKAGVGPYTSSPNFNVKRVDFSQAVVEDSLEMDSIFMNYIQLQSVSLPEYGAENIKSMKLAFFTTSVQEMDLSLCSGVISLRQAFDGCKQLIRVDISGCEKIEDLFLAFSNTPELREVAMPSRAPELKNIFHMIMTNKNLSGIRLPETVHPDFSSAYSFIDCRSLKEVWLPSNLAEMKEATFFSCPELKNIFYEGDGFLNWNETAFTSDRAQSNTHPGEITLYVKESCIDEYKADPGWRTLKEILPICATGIHSAGRETSLRIVSSSHRMYVESPGYGEMFIYTTDGREKARLPIEKGITPIPSLPPGYYFICGTAGKASVSLKFFNGI